MVHLPLQEIITGLSNSSGKDFFNLITLNLQKAIDADYCFVARIDFDKNVSKTISMANKSGLLDNFEYSLAYTPCSDVANDSICCYIQGVTELYPNDQLLVDMSIEGYIGTPLFGSDGDVLGIVVAMYEKPIEEPDLVKTLFDIFSGRISSEIELFESAEKLNELNKTLEKRVKSRTRELCRSIKELEITQHQLIQREKMASLGSIVAGVAHEINTPLGISLLANSVNEEIITRFEQKFLNDELSRHGLESFISEIKESNELISRNLEKAADLVTSFKRVAVEKNTFERQDIQVEASLKALVDSLKSEFNKHNAQVTLNISKGETLKTYPGDLLQVLTNIVMNSLIHGFNRSAIDNSDPDLKNLITITTRVVENDFKIIVEDNGIGISAEHIDQIFDPFYTTQRHEGATGLGLNITYNIVTSNLKGDISVESEVGKGSRFIIELPIETK